MNSEASIKVMLVDDSAVIRGLMSQALEAYEEITIVGRASNGEQAISLVQDMQPDIIVLDLEMPVMDGLTALPELVKAVPHAQIIMAATLSMHNASVSMEALSLGAADYLTKPSAKMGEEVDIFYRELVQKIYALSNKVAPVLEKTKKEDVVAIASAIAFVSPLHKGEKLNPKGLQALAIAASTGGPQALMQFFGHIKTQLMDIPIFITQHMPPGFTTILAEQIGKVSGLLAVEGKTGEEVKAGTVYIAPGDYHMVAERVEGRVMLRIHQEAAENFCRPAADPMLRALAEVYGSHLAVMVLTGMGHDGMEGAKHVVGHGGSVIAQDEASCVVYGMPKAIVEHGLCKAVMPLSEMAPFLVQQMKSAAHG